MSMPLVKADQYAALIVKWLSAFCERIEVAGSIRRRRPFCGDVDLVCIPKTEPREVQVDLLATKTVKVNLLREELCRYVRESGGKAAWLGKGEEQAGPEPKEDASNLLLRLPKCQLDVWCATPATWATRLMCRTGSKEHNIWLCQRAKDYGMHWNPYEGLSRSRGGEPLPKGTEEAIYEALRLPFIRPEDREADYLRRLP